MGQSLTSRVRAVAVRNRAAYWALRKVRAAFLGALPPRRFDAIPGRVHRNDLMLENTRPEVVENYRHTGQAAVQHLDQALGVAGRDWSSLDAVLDFGCGHGRVLRFLAERVPGASITACDLDPEAIAFCHSEFGAVPLISDFDIDAVALQSYDLCWMGSVLTHLDEPTSLATFRALCEHLRPGGIIAFSTHSKDLVSRFLDGEALDRVNASLDEHGFAYHSYDHYRDDSYGLAWHRPDYVRRTLITAAPAALEELLHLPSAWSGDHDVWAFQVP